MRLLLKESYTVDYAGFRWRAAALLLDIAILWFFNYVVNGLWNIASGTPWAGIAAGELGENLDVQVSYLGWRWLVFALGFVGYFVGFWGWRGQTPGKIITRLKITTLDGARIGWDRAAIRFIGYLLSIVFLGIGHLWLIFDARKQSIYDKMANTYVIRIPGKPTSKEITRNTD